MVWFTLIIKLASWRWRIEPMRGAGNILVPEIFVAHVVSRLLKMWIRLLVKGKTARLRIGRADSESFFPFEEEKTSIFKLLYCKLRRSYLDYDHFRVHLQPFRFRLCVHLQFSLFYLRLFVTCFWFSVRLAPHLCILRRARALWSLIRNSRWMSGRLKMTNNGKWQFSRQLSKCF